MNRYMQSLFCDDIRYEIGNKVSYMGVYGEQLLVPVLPVVLPKLCVAVSVVTPIDRPFQQLTLRLFKNEEILNEMEVPGETLEVPLSSSVKDADLASSLSFRTTFVLSSLSIEEACTLKVYAETEDETIPGVGLGVHQLQST